MVNDIVQYVGDALEFVFMSGGYVQVIIAVVIALLAGILLKKYSFNGAVNMTAVALLVFAIALAVVNFIEVSPEEFGPWLEGRVDVFLSLTLGQVLTAFVAFFIVISLAHFLVGAVSKK